MDNHKWNNFVWNWSLNPLYVIYERCLTLLSRLFTLTHVFVSMYLQFLSFKWSIYVGEYNSVAWQEQTVKCFLTFNQKNDTHWHIWHCPFLPDLEIPYKTQTLTSNLLNCFSTSVASGSGCLLLILFWRMW